MRKAMTEPEVMLWTRLRGRNLERPTFRRQHPFGSIILDFYCPAALLAVEVDGAAHWDDDAQAKDAARDRWLENRGVTVLRIPASEIYRDLGAAADGVIQAAQARMVLTSRTRFSPSTSRSSLRSATGPPPAASRGR